MRSIALFDVQELLLALVFPLICTLLDYSNHMPGTGSLRRLYESRKSFFLIMSGRRSPSKLSNCVKCASMLAVPQAHLNSHSPHFDVLPISALVPQDRLPIPLHNSHLFCSVLTTATSTRLPPSPRHKNLDLHTSTRHRTEYVSFVLHWAAPLCDDSSFGMIAVCPVPPMKMHQSSHRCFVC